MIGWDLIRIATEYKLMRTRPARPARRIERNIECKTVQPARFADPFEPDVRAENDQAARSATAGKRMMWLPRLG
jgi:hypothetical protein